MANFKYFGKAVVNQNNIHDESCLKGGWNTTGNFHWSHNSFTSYIEKPTFIFTTTVKLLVVMYGYKSRSLTLREKQRMPVFGLRNMLGSKIQKLSSGLHPHRGKLWILKKWVKYVTRTVIKYSRVKMKIPCSTLRQLGFGISFDLKMKG